MRNICKMLQIKMKFFLFILEVMQIMLDVYKFLLVRHI